MCIRDRGKMKQPNSDRHIKNRGLKRKYQKIKKQKKLKITQNAHQSKQIKNNESTNKANTLQEKESEEFSHECFNVT